MCLRRRCPGRSAASATRIRTPQRALLVLLVPFLLYVLPQQYKGTGDSIPAELLPVAIIHGHGFDLNEFPDPRQDLPYYVADIHGHIVSAYPILPGLLNVPIYEIAYFLHVDIETYRTQLSLVTAALLTSCSVLFLFLTLRELSGNPRHAFWFALLYAFGTNAWSNGGIVLFQHGPSLFFLSGAFYCLVRRDGQAVPWAGLLLGIAVANRPTNILFAAPLALYVGLHRRRAFPAFAALATIPAVLLAIYSQIYWESVLALGQGQGAPGFSGNFIRGFLGLLFSPARGLFIFSPIFAFAVVEGFRRLGRRTEDPFLTYLFVSTLLTIALYSKWQNWWGGHSFSYRLITEVSPALILLVAEAWRVWIRRSRLSRGLFYAGAFLAVFIQTLGVWPYPTGFNDNIDFETDRLWNWKENEITMGIAKGLVRYHLRAHEIRVHHTRPQEEAPAPRPFRYRVWWTWANNDDSIPGWYDSPADHQVVHGTLHAEGWAKSAIGEVDVRVILDNGRRVATPERYPRPDVAAALPRLGDTSRAGWKVAFPFAPGGPSVHELSVEFRDPNGHVRILPTLHFRWEPN